MEKIGSPYTGRLFLLESLGNHEAKVGGLLLRVLFGGPKSLNFRSSKCSYLRDGLPDTNLGKRVSLFSGCTLSTTFVHCLRFLGWFWAALGNCQLGLGTIFRILPATHCNQSRRAWNSARRFSTKNFDFDTCLYYFGNKTRFEGYTRKPRTPNSRLGTSLCDILIRGSLQIICSASEMPTFWMYESYTGRVQQMRVRFLTETKVAVPLLRTYKNLDQHVRITWRFMYQVLNNDRYMSYIYEEWWEERRVKRLLLLRVGSWPCTLAGCPF